MQIWRDTMEILQWVLITLLALIIIRRFLPVKGITNISVEQVKEKFSDKGVQFIDVRIHLENIKQITGRNSLIYPFQNCQGN